MTEDDAMLMPSEPIVSVPAPVTSMADKALATLMPLHEREVAKVRPAPNEVLAQVATSPEPGAVPPQLALAVRSVPVVALVIAAACELVTMAKAAIASATTPKGRK